MALLQEIVTDFGGEKGKGTGGAGGARKKEQVKPAKKARKESTKRKPVVDAGNVSENESLWGDGGKFSGNASPTSSLSPPPKRAKTGQAKPAKAVDGDFGEFSGYAKLLTADLDAQVNKRYPP